jgi:hypothetical protein
MNDFKGGVGLALGRASRLMLELVAIESVTVIGFSRFYPPSANPGNVFAKKLNKIPANLVMR